MLADPRRLDRLFLTDGGLETDMIFNRGVDLPCFAGIWLLGSAEGRAALADYYERYLAVAQATGTGFVLESATWRASPDWEEPLGITGAQLDDLNRAAIALMAELRVAWQSPAMPIKLSGCIGPRGDGYDPGNIMSVDEAEAYHAHQANVLVNAGAELLTALTMTNVNEGIGIARAAKALGSPVVISFTVETDGRLPTGDTLEQAIRAVDDATGGHPAYFMINCAHPSHFDHALDPGGAWVARIGGLRANASRCSHAELEAMTELDAGNPRRLGEEHAALLRRHPHLRVLGGCCGTDHRHVAAIAEACLERA